MERMKGAGAEEWFDAALKIGRRKAQLYFVWDFAVWQITHTQETHGFGIGRLYTTLPHPMRRGFPPMRTAGGTNQIGVKGWKPSSRFIGRDQQQQRQHQPFAIASNSAMTGPVNEHGGRMGCIPECVARRYEMEYTCKRAAVRL